MTDLRKELDGMIEEGLLVRIDFPKLELQKFASVVLMLANNKSYRLNGLMDFRTYMDSNIIDMSFSLEYETKESVLEFVEYICKVNTLEETYTIEVLDTIKIIPITGWLLEENKVIEEDEDFVIVKYR